MTPKYIDLINRFWRMDEQHGFSSEETRLYFYLLKVANASTPAWPDSFERADNKVAADNGIKSVNTMKKYRERLVTLGLIDFQAGGKGQGNRVRYQIRYQNLTPKTAIRHQKMTPILTPKFIWDAGLVSSKMSKFDTYTIYKRLKTVNTLTIASVQKKVKSFLASKKRIRKAPLVPRVPPKPQPKPMPKFGDPFTIKSDSESLNVPYSTWKSLYPNSGNEGQLRKLWMDLDDGERVVALTHTQGYMLSAPVRWLKSATNYLLDKEFNNPIIDRNDKPAQNTIAGHEKPRNPYGQGASLPGGSAYREQTIGRRNKQGDGHSG